MNKNNKKTLKNILIMGILCIMVFSMASCGDSKTSSSDSADNVDVDLTSLSSTMILSEVSNIMSNPDDYTGKTVKMTGNFAVYEGTGDDDYYTAVLIQDATQCCKQGIEFKLKGDAKYPDDYPEVDSEITVVGTFETYTEGDYTYARLKDAELV